jgi:hypothetical protein
MRLQIGLIGALQSAVPQEWREEARADNNVFFINVDRPGQILHAVLPLWYLLVGENDGNLSPKNDGFC